MKFLKFTPIFLTILLGFSFTALAQNESPPTNQPITVGLGSAKFNALLQTWALNDTTALNDASSNFRIRRVELKLSGSVRPRTRWFVMIDPAKSLRTGAIANTNDNKILQDFGVGFELSPNFELVAGQYKIPSTFEGLLSSGELLFPERSYVTRFFGDRRDPGVMLITNFKPLQFRVMASNGPVSSSANSANVDDTNASKDLTARLDYGFGDYLKVGAFGISSHSTLGYSTRQGANIQYEFEKFLARLEGVQGKDLDLDKNGLATEFSYFICNNFQGALRYDNFQQVSAPESSSSAYTAGATYYLEKNNSKVQLSYTALSNMAGANGTYVPTYRANGSLFVLNFQASL